MKKAVIIILGLWPLATYAADSGTSIITATTSDIGRPYTVIGAGCGYGDASSAGFDIITPEFESAFDGGIKKLAGYAAKAGGNAIVGIQVSPIVAGDRHGTLVCGTVVKFK